MSRNVLHQTLDNKSRVNGRKVAALLPAPVNMDNSLKLNSIGQLKQLLDPINHQFSPMHLQSRSSHLAYETNGQHGQFGNMAANSNELYSRFGDEVDPHFRRERWST